MKIYMQIVPNDDGETRFDFSSNYVDMTTHGWRLVNVLEAPDVPKQVLEEAQRAFEAMYEFKGGK